MNCFLIFFKKGGERKKKEKGRERKRQYLREDMDTRQTERQRCWIEIEMRMEQVTGTQDGWTGGKELNNSCRCDI